MTESQSLFSYGTLQQPKVQRAVFGRQFRARPDRFTGYRLSEVRITDPDVVAVSGSDTDPILVATDDPAGGVDGSALHAERTVCSPPIALSRRTTNGPGSCWSPGRRPGCMRRDLDGRGA